MEHQSNKQGPHRGQAPAQTPGERYTAERERELIGCCFHNYDLLSTLEALGLRASNFRVDLYGKFFSKLIAFRDRGDKNAFVEDVRRAGTANGKIIVAWADAAARLTCDDQERAEAIVYDRARVIIGCIRTITDCATWYDQLYKASGRQEIGGNDYLIASGIARRVNRRTGNAWPSNLTLAKETGLSLATVERAMRVLKEKRHLEIGRARPNILTPIVWAKMDAAKAKVSTANPATSNPSI
jgi:hypothetical protein